MERKEDVFTVARQFMQSRIILTAAELDLFTVVDEGSVTAEQIAQKLSLDRRALTRVMDCLVNFELLEKNGGFYSLTPEGATFSSKHPTSSLPMLLHMSSLWDSWSTLTEVVVKGSNLEQGLPRVMDPESRRAFIGAMHVVGRSLSEEIAGALDLSGFKKLLDVGGGSGTYTIAFLRKSPALKAVLFDMEGVIPMARERLDAEGFLDRAELMPGDFYRDELPGGCDLALLSAIIHQNSPEQNRVLYKSILHSLEPGGTLIIRDHIMDDSRTRPPEGALFAINMLVNTRGGDTYTFGEVEADLEEVGFTNVKLLRTGEKMDCLVGAVKPR